VKWTEREENCLVVELETERTHDGMSSDNAVDMGPAMLLEWTLLPKISAGMGGSATLLRTMQEIMVTKEKGTS
jgi:hypothetical protein